MASHDSHFMVNWKIQLVHVLGMLPTFSVWLMTLKPILGLDHMSMQALESSRLLASTMEVLMPQGPLQRAQWMT